MGLKKHAIKGGSSESTACPIPPKRKPSQSSQIRSRIRHRTHLQIVAIWLSTMTLISVVSINQWQLLLFMPLPPSAEAPPYSVLGNVTYGGSGWDAAYCIKECSSGGFVIAASTASFGAGGIDAWLIRTQVDGTVLWNHTYGGPEDDYGRSLVECTDGGFAIAGATGSYGAGKMDYWIVRTDNQGNVLWNKTYGGADDEWGWPIIECSDGGFAMTGCTVSFAVGKSDLWLIRTDADGNLVWNVTFGDIGVEDSSTSLLLCDDGGFAMAGKTDQEFGPDGIWLIRTDAHGQELWNKTYGPAHNGEGCGLIQCHDGGFAILGVGTFPLESDNITCYMGSTQWQILLIRTDEEGETLWEQEYGAPSKDEWAYSIVESSNGGFVIAGIQISCEDTSGLLIFVDEKGNLLWESNWGGNHTEYFFSIIEYHTRTFAIVGVTNSYGPAPLTRGLDVWLLQLTIEEFPNPTIHNTELLSIEAVILGLGTATILSLILVVPIILFYRRQKQPISGKKEDEI